MNPIPIDTSFKIKFTYTNKEYKYEVVKTFETDQIEHYTLYAANKNLVFRTNRIIVRKHSKTKKVDIKLIEGECLNMTFLQTIIDHIREAIKYMENYIPPETDRKNVQSSFDYDEWSKL